MRPLLLATALASLAVTSASAQAWSYPAFQTPVIEHREFNFGVATAGSFGTTFLLQWREQASERVQFTLEAGISSPDNKDFSTLLVVGAQGAYQAMRATENIPFDILLTAGAGAALGDPVTLRIPIGVNIGHRFELEKNMTLTPYLHPRISLDLCGDCGDAAGAGVAFDAGVSWEVTPQVALRAAAFFGGGPIPKDGFGLSFAYRPPGLKR